MVTDATMGSRTTERFGRTAEQLAAFWLALKGYQVLARRLRNRFGEIDLVCQRGRCLVFVEVKGRRTTDLALHALGRQQQRRIAAAARWYLKEQPQLAELDCRFDLVTIDRFGLPRHVRDVWRPTGY
jgi:putative endonuclease